MWGLLCRAALGGAALAARALGREPSDQQLERSELFVSCGVAAPLATPSPSVGAGRAVDWAKLDELGRGRLAREMKGAWRK